MTLQQLFASTEIDFKKVKLVRHNLSKNDIADYYKKGYLDLYQTIQSVDRFANAEYVLSFLGEEGTKGKYLGCYKVGRTTPFDESAFPDDFKINEDMKECVVYSLEKTEVFSELIDRLVIDWGKGTLNWCHNGTTEKEILAIQPVVTKHPFPGYSKVILDYSELREIVFNASAHSVWQQKLSAVAGVYLITDKKTGMHYVGSAYGEDGVPMLIRSMVGIQN